MANEGKRRRRRKRGPVGKTAVPTPDLGVEIGKAVVGKQEFSLYTGLTNTLFAANAVLDILGRKGVKRIFKSEFGSKVRNTQAAERAISYAVQEAWLDAMKEQGRSLPPGILPRATIARKARWKVAIKQAQERALSRKERKALAREKGINWGGAEEEPDDDSNDAEAELDVAAGGDS